MYYYISWYSSFQRGGHENVKNEGFIVYLNL